MADPPPQPGIPATVASTPKRIAVVGAGLAGLACARTLAGAGLSVVVFERAPQPGGRTATRTTAVAAFDYGAQFFVARDHRFATVVDGWTAAGVATRWPGRCVTLPNGPTASFGSSLSPTPENGDTPRFIGTPGMDAIARHLAADLDIRFDSIITRVRRNGTTWSLHGNIKAAGPFDGVAVAGAAPQAVPLLAAAPRLAAEVATVPFDPCWALMLAFASSPRLDFDAARVIGTPIAWMARNNAKPGRSAVNAWTIHATPAWSAAHLMDRSSTVIAALLPVVTRLGGHPLPPVTFTAAHRWRFARTARPLGRPCLYDPALGIGACGDWCLGASIESAYLSGIALAERILEATGHFPRPAINGDT